MRESQELMESPTQPGPKRLKIAPPTRPDNPMQSENNSSSALGSPTPSPIEATKTTTTVVPLAPAGAALASLPANGSQSGSREMPASQTVFTTEIKTPLPPTATAATSRSRRTSLAPKPTFSSSPSAPSDLGISGSAVSHLRSRTSARTAAASTAVKAASAEPPVKRESRELRELRRMSNVSLPSPFGSKNTRDATAVGIRSSGRRGKRPAPGLITADEDGRKVSVGTRKAAPAKKGAAAGGRGGVRGRMDGDGKAADTSTAAADTGEDFDLVDPDEPRYCVCGDVSYGTMIACENDDVSSFLS